MNHIRVLGIVFQTFSYLNFHFTVVCLVPWPIIASEARGDHALMHVNANYFVLKLLDLHNKTSKVCIKANHL